MNHKKFSSLFELQREAMSDCVEKFVVVDTEYGPVKGEKKESMFGLQYLNFQGIPYMAPPVGKLRFRDAQPPEKWTEPLHATKEGSPFCHFDFFNFKAIGDLDGGFINVYTRNVDPEEPAPVMVYIHGLFLITKFMKFQKICN
jgi:carboxylesterase type B